MKRITMLLVGFASLLFSLPVINAQVVTLSPASTNRVLSIGPNNNYSDLSVYNIGGNTQYSLLKFDLSSIAAGQTISSATLNLIADTTYGANAGNLSIDVFRVTQDYQSGQVSYNEASSGVAWVNQGGDAVGTTGLQVTAPYASYTLNPSNGGTVSWDLTNLVNEWYQGTYANYGLQIRAADGVELQFTNSVNLTVTAVPEPSTSLLLILLLGGFAFLKASPKMRFGCRAE